MAFQNSKGKEGGCGGSLSWKSEGMRGFAIGILQAWRISTWDRQECIIFLENTYFVDLISSDLCVSRFVAFKLQSSGKAQLVLPQL